VLSVSPGQRRDPKVSGSRLVRRRQLLKERFRVLQSCTVCPYTRSRLRYLVMTLDHRSDLRSPQVWKGECVDE